MILVSACFRMEREEGSTLPKKVKRKANAAWRSSSKLELSRSARPSVAPACAENEGFDT